MVYAPDGDKQTFHLLPCAGLLPSKAKNEARLAFIVGQRRIMTSGSICGLPIRL